MRRTHPVLAMIVLAALVIPATAARSDAGPTGPRDEVVAHGDIVISNDAEFTEERGVKQGSGTAKDPFVISGWDVPNIHIRDTAAHVIVRDNVIHGRLTLNWNGHHVDIHHNSIGDLRVNENVERTGESTSGHIWNNQIGLVGQLRHFGGEFEANVIGSEDALAANPDFRAVNFDGFHRARFHDNTIFGYMDAKLHGHYHGSSYKGESHGHTAEYEVDEYGLPTNPHAGNEHMKRYHQVFIYNNTIRSTHAWALRYTDTNHAGDDRTANSEEDKFLNGPHVHFTKVHLDNNELIGGSLTIDVFNAEDENHFGYAPGVVNIRRNIITLDRDLEEVAAGRHGIFVRHARYLTVNILHNKVFGPNTLGENDPLKLERELYNGAGVNLNDLAEAKVYIYDNDVTNRRFGVQARTLPKSVKWWIDGQMNSNVKQDVDYDETVANPPRKRG